MLSLVLDDALETPLRRAAEAAGQEVNAYAALLLQNALKQTDDNGFNFKQALVARLQEIPNVAVMRHEDRAVFTVYIPANDVETEYAVYHAESDIYGAYSNAALRLLWKKFLPSPLHTFLVAANEFEITKRHGGCRLLKSKRRFTMKRLFFVFTLPL